jgi:hypothetical protein
LGLQFEDMGLFDEDDEERSEEDEEKLNNIKCC